MYDYSTCCCSAWNLEKIKSSFDLHRKKLHSFLATLILWYWYISSIYATQSDTTLTETKYCFMSTVLLRCMGLRKKNQSELDPHWKNKFSFLSTILQCRIGLEKIPIGTWPSSNKNSRYCFWPHYYYGPPASLFLILYSATAQWCMLVGKAFENKKKRSPKNTLTGYINRVHAQWLPKLSF